MPVADELLRVGVGRLARVGELRGDLLEVVELRDVGLVADRDQHELAAFFALPTLHTFTRGDGRGERVEVAVDVLRVGELVGRADDVAQDFLGRGNGRRGGQMIDELGEEDTARSCTPGSFLVYSSSFVELL